MKPIIPYQPVAPLLIIINVLVTCIYFSWWLLPSHVGNPWLFGLLFAGEIYHIIMAFTFWLTIWPEYVPNPRLFNVKKDNYSIDVFIPVVGEPLEIIKTTALAAKHMKYPILNVYILNDGRVAKNPNWSKVEILAKEIGVTCITRTIPGGAKAGNINHALKQTHGEFIAIFDADMIPHPDFAQKIMPFFSDPHVGFVQSPQYYKNYQENRVTAGSWDQQKLFFGPILRGKEKNNAVFICGTNVIIRRKALEEAGGMIEDNIAEDFLTSLIIHQHGWKSRYVAEVLAEGLAPQDLQSYYKQQFRWSRGSIEILFIHNPIFSKRITWSQKIQYLSSALYYLNGLIILIDMLMPLVYLYTGIQPVAASTTSFAIFFLPFMFLNLYTLNIASGYDVSFMTFSFTYSLWYLQLQAIVSLLLGQKVTFSVTPKQAQRGIYFHLIIPHCLYVIAAGIGFIIAINREALTPSVMTNIAWTLFSIILFIPFIVIALNIHPIKTVKSVNYAPSRI